MRRPGGLRYTPPPTMGKFEHHIFVCENERPADDPRGCCSAKGSVAIREALKKECNKRGWKGIVRVNKAGCLDQCHLGPTVVIYPEQIWLGGVKLEDVPKIADALAAGAPLAAASLAAASLAAASLAGLLIPDEHLTGKGAAALPTPGTRRRGFSGIGDTWDPPWPRSSSRRRRPGGRASPNRIVLPAMVTRLCGEDGHVNDAIRERYVRFAEGGRG